MKKQNFFVNRPVVAIVIAIVTLIIGVISLIGLPIEQYPNITPPMVSVRANYTGASALNVEESVTSPLEQQINGVENMLYMKSINSNDGTMNIQITFDVGTDPDMNTVFAQNRVSSATAKLPEEVKRLGVTTEKSLPNVLMLVTVTSDGRYDQNFLGNYALINIKDILARIKGIGRVDVLGASDYSMRIWIKPDRLAQLEITVPEILAAIRQQNIIVPGGKFGDEPAPPGNEFTYTVRLPERLQTEEEFGEIVVRTNESGSQVKLKDLARIELGVETYRMKTRLNGEIATVLAVYPAPGSNAVELAEKVKLTMTDLSKNFPEGIKHEISLDATAPITAGIAEIIETLFIALALVILVVFIFIQDWRATLIPTIAIPVSLVGAFILFPLLGFTVNVLSLLGIVLAIGIVVDDAIVVVEAVQVNIEKGMTPKDATNQAMKEVTGPVIATTLVLIAVFVPVSAMGGITGSLYQQFAITIAVSVAFSSVNALTLSPALCSLLLRKQKPYKGFLGKFFAKFNKGFDRSTDKYMNFTNIVTRKITRGIIFIGISVVLVVIVGRFVPGGFIPEEDMGYLYVNIQLPNASSLQRSDMVAKTVEKILERHEEIEYYTTAVGFSLLTGTMSSNAGFLFISLKNWDERDITALELVNILNKEFYIGINSAQVFAFGPPAIPGLGKGSGFTFMLQDKGGNTPEFLAEQSAKFMQAAMQRPEIGRIFTTFQAGVPQKFIDINRDKVLKAGISLNDLYNTVGAFLGGAYVNDFNRFGRLYKAYIQAEPEYRQNAEQVDLFFLRNINGDRVPLSAFIEVKDVSGPDFTNRYNLYRSVELTGGPAEGYSSTEAMDALEEVAAEILPPGIGYEWSNMSFQEKKASGSAMMVFALALVFVFLILAAQYESWSLPFSILMGTPFAILGALLFLFLARFLSPSYENNIFTQISLVMLIGMAAKNAILIVEFANEKFKEGFSLLDSAIESAKLRFRPILMTAFSFILGVLPLVIASGSGAEARKVMGVALLGGMSIATFLGVFFYPVLYIFIGKIGKYEQKRELKSLNQTEKSDE
ncbi:MAG: multidrug efflux RND transporter permease subunit [Ignavibacteria bacterium]|nr:multidrug efflux RND transporter permease subunit [Ignavibacteria bacterium]MBT8382056.1 multidrug efflux RND transporter permease subunit [Ignavibacteria bacterium]MBT8392471.1 multidrug efflux RND transporter permease subunit [Ignavibacteria bacterium]NNJ52053.1 multidrug efflux RND transporter permease subunit [Ignavibacteriaceae bacterium]NNL19898.1 multidrug efflux RND transporter permease subunit [Ignavibacteriaceae bacterium]